MIAAYNFAISLFLSITLVPFLMRYAGILGLVDRPDGVRKIHTKIVPKSGGLAIAISSLLPIVLLTPILNDLAPLLVGALVIVIAGYLDDRHELSPKWKILGQAIAIFIFLASTPGLISKPLFLFIELPDWLSYVILFVFLLGVTNAINLSDGLDGLAAGMTLISLCLVAFLAGSAGLDGVMYAALALVGALMGFLRYNTHPASVFMGDTGSQFIGFCLAALAVYTTQSENCAASPVLPLFIIGAPILDTLVVITIRLREGKHPFSPDKNHIHHQLMKLGLYHHEAVAGLYFIQIGFVLGAYLFRFSSDFILVIGFSFIAASTVGLILLSDAKSIRFRSPEKHADKERRNLLLRRLNWVYFYGADIILCMLVLAWGFLVITTREPSHAVTWLSALSIFASLVFAAFLNKKFANMAIRVASYSASALALYSLEMTVVEEFSFHLLDALLLCVAIFLVVSIRMTRKQEFHLNNQDILVLFILSLGPIISVQSTDGINIGVMLFRLLVMIYAIEYLISKNNKKHIPLLIFANATLAALVL